MTPPDRPFPATGRGVLVTGGSRGIGAAIAAAFAANGDRVAVHYGSRADDAEAVVAGLPGTGHVAVGGDLADPDAVEVFVAAAVAGLGGVDVLVNNAGVFSMHPPLDTSYADWRAAWERTIGVNLLGPANVTWCVARHLVDAGRPGRIVNVSSRGAYRGEPTQPAYGASKGGLNSFGQSMARALGPHGITVAAVAPGWVATEMAAERLAERGPKILAEQPTGRITTPEDVASAVLWLASPAAEMANGTIVDLNGGSYLRP